MASLRVRVASYTTDGRRAWEVFNAKASSLAELVGRVVNYLRTKGWQVAEIEPCSTTIQADTGDCVYAILLVSQPDYGTAFVVISKEP